jgi:phosphohistidine swiveling domain-containing protein
MPKRELSEKFNMSEISYIKTVTRPYPPFYISLISAGHADKNSWKNFLGFDYSLDDLIIVDNVWMYPKCHMIDFAVSFTKKIFQSKSLFEKIKVESLDREQRLIQLVDGDICEFAKNYSYYMPALGLFFICDDLIEEKVHLILTDCSSKEDADVMVESLSIPIEDNFYTKERLELSQTNDVEAHIKKWHWLNSRYGKYKPYTIEEALYKKQELEKEDFFSNYKQEKKRISDTIKKAKELMGEDSYFVDVMQFFIYYRTQRTDIMNMVMTIYRNKLEDIADEMDVKYEDLLFMTYDEVMKGKYDKKIIDKRKKGFVFTFHSGRISILIGTEYLKFKENYANNDKKQNFVKGRVAFSGLVKGPVKIVRNELDMAGVQQGDILVTYMTTPNMIPAMKLASAFVTNEGGITCHAAIIAREMGKPCIIGTQESTDIFEDGDMVEVDADKGIVKRLQI